jgi:magnesium-transporting ATPase (P-type)
MDDKPRSPKESIFNKLMFHEVAIAGLVMGMSVFVFWFYMIRVLDFSLPLARSYVMLLMVFMQNLHALNCRSEKTSIFKMPISRNWLILFSIVSSILLEIIVTESSFLSNIFGVQSLPLIDIFIVFLFSLPILIVMEVFKYTKSKIEK